MCIVLRTVVSPGAGTVGRIEIQNDVKLPSEPASGQKGAVVEVCDLVIEGYNDRFLTIALQAIKESPRFVPHDYTMMLADSDLHRCLGPGTHEIYLVFTVNAQLESEYEPLPGGSHYRSVTVDMPLEPPVDTFLVKREPRSN